ncbi:hypothetical protein [Nocardia takedensis]|uniref:hypothetical protein n=1 Tax=Nocardia takedensis TaxID=259390 RepID=UPI0002F4114D|nr:hypothetical protein [Nocardia takedensis]
MAGMHVGGPVLVGDPVLDPTPVESGGIPEWATVESGYPGTYQPPVAPQVELLVGGSVVAVGSLADGDVTTLTVASDVAITAGEVLTVRVAEPETEGEA